MRIQVRLHATVHVPTFAMQPSSASVQRRMVRRLWQRTTEAVVLLDRIVHTAHLNHRERDALRRRIAD